MSEAVQLPPLPEGDYIDTGLERRSPGFTAYQMRAFATAAVLVERERCARLCDEIADRIGQSAPPGESWSTYPAEECAAAIRKGE